MQQQHGSHFVACWPASCFPDNLQPARHAGEICLLHRMPAWNGEMCFAMRCSVRWLVTTASVVSRIDRQSMIQHCGRCLGASQVEVAMLSHVDGRGCRCHRFKQYFDICGPLGPCCQGVCHFCCDLSWISLSARTSRDPNFVIALCYSAATSQLCKPMGQCILHTFEELHHDKS